MLGQHTAFSAHVAARYSWRRRRGACLLHGHSEPSFMGAGSNECKFPVTEIEGQAGPASLAPADPRLCLDCSSTA